MAQALGERLRQARQARHLTVYEAAKRVGMPNQALYRLEKAKALGHIQVGTLKKLAALYGVTIDYLVYDVDYDEEDAHAA